MKKRIPPILFIVVVLAIAAAFPMIGSHARNEYRSQYDKIYAVNEAGADIFEVASSTSRIGLGPVVTQLTDVKRELQAIEVVGGLDTYKTLSLQAMDKSITLMTTFMGDTEASLEEPFAELSDAVEARNAEQARVLQRCSASIWTWGLETIF